MKVNKQGGTVMEFGERGETSSQIKFEAQI